MYLLARYQYLYPEQNKDLSSFGKTSRKFYFKMHVLLSYHTNIILSPFDFKNILEYFFLARYQLIEVTNSSSLASSPLGRNYYNVRGQMSEHISVQKGGYCLFNYAVNMEKVKRDMTFNNVAMVTQIVVKRILF